jgi:hypothetical protein
VALQQPLCRLPVGNIERKRAAGAAVGVRVAADGGGQAVVLQQPLGALRRGQGFKPEIRQHFIPSLLPPLQPMPQVFARSRIKELTKNAKKCIIEKNNQRRCFFMSKILIADDEQKIRKLVCDFLRNVGYETIEAEDGDEAFAVFQ